jgi:hypothetical protein
MMLADTQTTGWRRYEFSGPDRSPKDNNLDEESIAQHDSLLPLLLLWPLAGACMSESK